MSAAREGLVAEWESAGGAHGVALRQTGEGTYAYRARLLSLGSAGGGFPASDDAAAIAYMEAPAWPDGPRRVDTHQPDANVEAMRRVWAR